WVACQTVAAYHNYLAYNVPEPDGFAEDMAQREARAAAHMQASSSEDDESCVGGASTADEGDSVISDGDCI
ncbi:MAG: hypothetical protein ACK56I_09280, partial [bacterium]